MIVAKGKGSEDKLIFSQIIQRVQERRLEGSGG
jgi:hypothetical protein